MSYENKMDLGLYALSLAANLMVIYLIPSDAASLFLQTYSATSMVMGVIAVYIFSKANGHPLLIHLRLPLTLFCVFLSIAGYAYSLPTTLAYVVSLILSDYYISQSGCLPLTRWYRGFLIFSVIPASMGLSFFQEQLVLVRTLGVCAFLFYANVFDLKVASLRIHKPFAYIALTHLAYFGCLGVISTFISLPGLRIWYVGAQVGQGLLLKMMDFKVRGTVHHGPWLEWSLLALAFILGAVLFLHDPQPLAVTSYWLALLCLKLVDRYSTTP